MEEGTMISATEHQTMAVVGAVVGAALGGAIGVAALGLPTGFVSLILGGVGGAFVGWFL
jgi:hypothetical protein